MRISIIIPAFNAEKYILKALQSVINQDYEDVEIIIVNDGSTDKTIQVVNSFMANNPTTVLKVINIPNGGLANARNVGIKTATGEYFINLDADDYLKPGILNKIAQRALSSFFDVCFYGMEDVDEGTGIVIGSYLDRFKYISSSISGREAFVLKGTKKCGFVRGVPVTEES